MPPDGSGGASETDSNVGQDSGPPLAPVDITQPRTIWLAGDSTVANGNTPCPTGWGKHFGDLFNDAISVKNSAAGGRSVRTWMYQVQTEMGSDGECILTRDAAGEPLLQDRWQAMLDGMQAGDVLLVQFGINDGSRTCDRHVGLEAFKASYGVLAEAAFERGAQPVFITPASAIACSGDTPTPTRGGFVDATFEAGENFDVPVIDLHQASIDLYAELGFCPVPGGDVSQSTGGEVGDFFCDDHTHFSDTGSVAIARLVSNAMLDLGLPIAEYLK
jgi:lysophospholipase L1-like esterase